MECLKLCKQMADTEDTSAEAIWCRVNQVVHVMNQALVLDASGHGQQFYALVKRTSRTDTKLAWEATTMAEMTVLCTPYTFETLVEKQLRGVGVGNNPKRKSSKATPYTTIVNAFQLWYNHPHRRTVENVVWHPEPDPDWLNQRDNPLVAPTGLSFHPNAYKDGNRFLNTWGGWAFTYRRCTEIIEESSANQSLLMFILSHLRWCWASTDVEYVYLLRFLATLIQFPGVVTGKVVVCAGAEGCGKGFIWEIMGMAMGDCNFVTVQSVGDIFGQFNARVSKSILAFLDEVIWSRNPKEANALKTQTTADTIRSEGKGKDQIMIENHRNLVQATNHLSYAMPASENARRFFGLHCTLDLLTESAFFRRLYDGPLSSMGPQWVGEVKNSMMEPMVTEANSTSSSASYGGLAVFLKFLWDIDLSVFNINDIPVTYLTLRNKHTMLPDLKRWFYDACCDGYFTTADPEQVINFYNSPDGRPYLPGTRPKFFISDLLNSYKIHPHYSKFVSGAAELAQMLDDVIGKSSYHITTENRFAGRSCRAEKMVELPPLEECRDRWEKLMPGAVHGWHIADPDTVDPVSEWALQRNARLTAVNNFSFAHIVKDTLALLKPDSGEAPTVRQHKPRLATDLLKQYRHMTIE